MLLLTLASPAGAKRIVGNRGSNTLIATGVRDVVWARAGHDLVSGGASADTIYGEEGNDVLLGDAGNDTIRGGGSHDTILGGSGRDTIHGEWGSDVVDAGGGNDVVLMGTSDGAIDSPSTRKLSTTERTAMKMKTASRSVSTISHSALRRCGTWCPCSVSGNSAVSRDGSCSSLTRSERMY